jgi:hypothetical protein
MVNQKVATRRFVPAYSLGTVHGLAAAEKVHYAGDRVFADTSELGLEHSDVCDCLQQLASHHFDSSIQYEGRQTWHDVYKMSITAPSGRAHDMYIKFKMFNECLVLYVCSFHPHGWSE